MFAKETIKQIQPYRIVPQEAWIKENVVKLDWNEATCPISPYVRQALLDAVNTLHLNWYPNVNNEKLTTLLAAYAGVEESQVLYFASSDSAQEYIARTFLNEHDNVLILGPTYDNFRVTCQSESYNILFHFLEENLIFNLAAFEKNISKLKPKLIYISNPNNPTGTEYTLREITYLLNKFPNTLFMIDEAYIEFAVNAESSVSLVNQFNNVVVTRTFSKAFGLASFRIGYVVASEDILSNISKIRNTKSISSLSQVAAIAALEDIQYMQAYVKEVAEAKKYFINTLTALGIPFHSQGGNFLLVKMKNPKEFFVYLKDNAIFVRDYTHVEKLHGYNIRITIGQQAQMHQVVEIIARYIKISNI
jgi:histidinol-phosphate aminotransferase